MNFVLLSKTKILEIRAALEAEELVIFPTETVYALGCGAFSPKARNKIYGLKGRDTNKALQLLVPHVKAMEKFVDLSKLDKKVFKKLTKLMPGPLTAIFPASPLGVMANGGKATIGIRVPDHRLARELLSELDFPLATTSANFSGGPEPTAAKLIPAKLKKAAKCVVVESGPTKYKMASTVIDLTSCPSRVLREGAIPLKEIRKCLKI